MDVIEAMETCSAARYLKPDPVPLDLIERVIYSRYSCIEPRKQPALGFHRCAQPRSKAENPRSTRAAIQGDGSGLANDRAGPE